MKNCQRCGAEFAPRVPARGNPQKFCSPKCQRREMDARQNARRRVDRTLQTGQCPRCGKVFQQPQIGAPKKYCSNFCSLKTNYKRYKETLITHSCQCCGQIFVASKHDSRRYCSKFCYGFMTETWPKKRKRRPYEPHPDGLTCDECDRPLWGKGKCSLHYSAMRTATGQRQRYVFTCKYCHVAGESYEQKTSAHADCARRANWVDYEYSRSTALVPYVKPKRVIKRITREVKTPSLMVAGTCVICGSSFIEPSSFRTITCSSSCSKKYKLLRSRRSGIRKRCREAGVEYDPTITRLEVYERSGWRCGICYGEVDPRIEWGSMWAATWDHIKPIARGGAHVRDNLQLAHHLCNSTKTDSYPGDQIP